MSNIPIPCEEIEHGKKCGALISFPLDDKEHVHFADAEKDGRLWKWWRRRQNDALESVSGVDTFILECPKGHVRTYLIDMVNKRHVSKG